MSLESASQSPVSAQLADLPRIKTPLAADEIGRRMIELAKRGKLPNHAPDPRHLFRCDLFGEPLDYSMSCAAKGDGGTTTLRFAAAMKLRAPVIFWIIAALTVQPGMWMTDSMIRTYIPSYDIPTWWWYLPLTVLPLPFVWIRMVRKSRLASREHAIELIDRIRAEVDGSIES